MIMKKYILLVILFFAASGAFGSLQHLFQNLDPLSVAQHFAFYELYPDSTEGQIALKNGYRLLNMQNVSPADFFQIPEIDIGFISSLINKWDTPPLKALDDLQLKMIEKLGQNLKNRRLKTFNCWDEEVFIKAAPEEIDLSRGLFIAELGAKNKLLIRYYEACLDLMALQILPRLASDFTDAQIAAAISHFIFYEMGFRFPPLSAVPQNIDAYTFLPSVLDSRRGVCLGVSILYLCLAQRLGLPLEIITPPGHIFVRCGQTNIENTARGTSLPDEAYLSIETKSLPKRTIKEVIGMAFFNEAGVYWKKEDYAKAIRLYEKAKQYIPNDPLIDNFLAYNYLFSGQKKKGRSLLCRLKGFVPDYAVAGDTIVDDYLAGRTNLDGIKAVFAPVDETRTSILAKQKELAVILRRYPRFRAGLLQLATAYLQLGRQKEAIDILQKYDKFDSQNPVVSYYLAALCLEQGDCPAAWRYLTLTQKILRPHRHNPKAIKELERELKAISPLSLKDQEKSTHKQP